MIKATVGQVRAAYRAITSISNGNRLPQKPAWRISRLLGQLKPVIVSFEEEQLRMFKDAGGVEKGGAVQIEAPVRGEKETDAEWQAKTDEYGQRLSALNDQIRALDKEEVEIDYDAISLSLFPEDDEKTPVERQLRFNAKDFEDAGPFIKE